MLHLTTCNSTQGYHEQLHKSADNDHSPAGSFREQYGKSIMRSCRQRKELGHVVAPTSRAEPPSRILVLFYNAWGVQPTLLLASARSDGNYQGIAMMLGAECDITRNKYTHALPVTPLHNAQCPYISQRPPECCAYCYNAIDFARW